MSIAIEAAARSAHHCRNDAIVIDLAYSIVRRIRDK